MAVITGTNSGFVTLSPTANPGGSNTTFDVSARAVKAIAPSGAAKITEIGWWSDNWSEEANFEIALYSHDSGSDKPKDQLFIDTTNAKGTAAGWKKIAVDWAITEGVTYWITVVLANTSTASKIDYTTPGVGGDRYSLKGAVISFVDPWWAASSEGTDTFAIYAVWESSIEELVGSSAGQSTASGTLTKPTIQLAGSLSAQSGADATLQEWNNISGSSAGASGSSAHLTRHDTQLTGSLSAQSTTTGTLYEWNHLVGSITGVSGATGTLRERNHLVGTISVQSTVSGQLTVKHWQIFSKYTIVPGDANARLDNATEKFAQTFPVYYRHNIYKLELRLKRFGNPGSLHIEVRENDPNTQEYYPTGALIAETDFNTSGIDTEIEWVTIYLDSPGWLEELPGMYNPGESNEEKIPRIYGLVLSCSGADTNNWIEWGYGSTEPKLDWGRYCYYDGADWSNNPAVDFLFIEYGYRADLDTIIPPQIIHPALTCSITIRDYEPEAPFIGGEYKTTIIGDTTFNSNFPFSLFEIEYTGEIVNRYLDDFYYRIHIYERPINLGLILADIEREFWVWNAFFAVKTLEDITIDGELNLVGQEAPHNFQPLEARKYIAEITKEGVPDYRAEITFEFEDPLGEIVVVITGTRAVVLFWRPKSKIRETLEWKTAILRAHGGIEQRIKLRQTPRQFFRLQFIFDTNKISSQFDAMLHRWQKRSWIIPVWTEYVIHSGALSAEAVSIDIDTKYADFRADSYAMIWKSSLEYEVVAIDSVDVDKLNLKVGIENSYTEDQYILPVRAGYMISKNTKQNFNSPVSTIEASFVISDNIDIAGHISEKTLEFIVANPANSGDGDVSGITPAEGEPTEIWMLTCVQIKGVNPARFSVIGSISGDVFDLATVGFVYDNGKIAFKINAGGNDFVIGDNFQTLEVLTTPSYMIETHQEESDGLLDINDFETGILRVRSDKEFNLLSQNHIFFNDTKKTSWELRQFLYWLNGRQRAILIPTYRDDLIQKDNIGGADTYFYIENIKLAINMGANELRTYVGFYFPDGTLLIRKITAITEIDETKEKIDINASLGKVVNLGDCKICFVDKCRLASDRVEIDWPFAFRNECKSNLIRVP